MKDYLSEIDQQFPIRNSAEQKAAFRKYALAQAGAVPARAEENEEHTNLVFGDPAAARVIFTAHYDTPRRGLLPNLMLVTNPILSWTYRLGTLIPFLLAPALAAAWGVWKLLDLDWTLMSHRMLLLGVYTAVYFGLFYLMFRGPANKRNRNDNTSGTAAVLELMEALGERSGVAYILFDDEEKGKKGSKAFAKAHPEIREEALVVNLDCVGNGDTHILCGTAAAEADPLYQELQKALADRGLSHRFYPAGKASMNSDQKSFDKGVGVCACRYKPLVGYFTDRIHTARDTVADPDTVARLSEALAAFAERV